MKLKTLLVFNTIVALVFGIPFVLVPATMCGLFGIASSPGTNLAGQFFGVTLIGVGLICWLARDVADAGAKKAIILAQLVSAAIGFIVALMGTISGVMNVTGWLSVVIYLLLTLGYAYFQFMKPKGS
jgi:hypothetical protein